MDLLRVLPIYPPNFSCRNDLASRSNPVRSGTVANDPPQLLDYQHTSGPCLPPPPSPTLPPMPNPCPFCHPAPAAITRTTPLALALFDAYPVSPGHTLIIPRRQVARLSDTTPEERAELFDVLDETQTQLEAEHSPDGFNIGINEGEAGGQTIEHLHIHLIPRYAGDVAGPVGAATRSASICLSSDRPERS